MLCHVYQICSFCPGSGSGSESDDEGSGSGSDEDGEKKDGEGQTILDQTETNMVAFRRLIYLTIQSSLDVDECAHKIMKVGQHCIGQ